MYPATNPCRLFAQSPTENADSFQDSNRRTCPVLQPTASVPTNNTPNGNHNTDVLWDDTSSSESEHSLWEVEQIIDEKKDMRGKRKFLLQWVGIDRDTGKPTWVPSFCMSELIESNTRRVVRLRCWKIGERRRLRLE